MAGCIPLTFDQVTKVHNSFPLRNRRRNQVLFLVGCWTGLRISDIVKLRWENFISNGNWLPMLRIKESKNKRYREIPLRPPIIKALKQYLTEQIDKFGVVLHDDFIFTRSTGAFLKPHRMIDPIKAACRAAGLTMQKRTRGTHSMRQTFADLLLNDLLDSGLTIADAFKVLCDAMNHSDIRTTMAYVEYSLEKVRQYVQGHMDREFIQ